MTVESILTILYQMQQTKIIRKMVGASRFGGQVPRKRHNQKDTSSPEAIRPIRMASRPVRPPHPLGGVTKSYDLSAIASPSCSPAGVRPLDHDLLLEFFAKNWSGRADLNGRPPAPKAGALTRLRYAPISVFSVPSVMIVRFVRSLQSFQYDDSIVRTLLHFQ